jgi:hypothetical protein
MKLCDILLTALEGPVQIVTLDDPEAGPETAYLGDVSALPLEISGRLAYHDVRWIFANTQYIGRNLVPVLVIELEEDSTT